MKQISLLLMLLFTLLPAKIFGQKTIPGYITDLNGNTINGTFKFDEKWRSFDSIIFKSENAVTERIIKPENVRLFGIQDYRFVSATLLKEDLNRGKTPDVVDSSKVRKFLQILYQGPRNLYSYYDNENKVHLFILDSSDITKLIFKEYPVRKIADKGVDYIEYIRKDQRYIGQLILSLSDCPELKARISHVDYNARAISSIYEKYYKCVDQTPGYSLPKEKYLFRPGLIAGMMYGNISFDKDIDPDFFMLAHTDYEVSDQIVFGAFMEIVLPRNHGNFSVIPELLYNAYHFQGTYHYVFNPNVNYDYETSIDNTYLGLNLLTRYTIPISKLKFFLNAGIHFNYLIKGETTMLQTRHSFGSIFIEPETDAFLIKRTEEGFIFGFGCQYNKFSLEGRYGFGDGISDPNVESNLKQLSILLGFRFK